MAKLNLIPPPDENPKPDKHKPKSSGKSRIEQHKKKKNKTKVKHAIGSVWSTFMTILGLVILCGALYGLYYAWQNQDQLDVENLIPGGNLVIKHKETIPGYTINKERKQGQASKDFSEWVSPRYMVIVQSDITTLSYYYELPENTFNSIKLGDSIPKDDTIGWRKISEAEYKDAHVRKTADDEDEPS